ncbi:hypothetical protein pdam_00011505 [Pocillopora damicornis]|uniref:Uncharacterized protein n=1 Tax=Pocillopora damicornis TaxID=46731 RepID=A0A3M6TUU9_POCDA|nr:hypothetical protein pdam_00011505 [Pocillopora damicornis]
MYVREFSTEKQPQNYRIDIQHLFTGIKSFDDKEYICKTVVAHCVWKNVVVIPKGQQDLQYFANNPLKGQEKYTRAEKKTLPRINNPLYSGLTVNATNSDEDLSELHLQINSGKDSEVCPISDESSEQRTTDDENEEERGSFE